MMFQAQNPHLLLPRSCLLRFSFKEDIVMMALLLEAPGIFSPGLFPLTDRHFEGENCGAFFGSKSSSPSCIIYLGSTQLKLYELITDCRYRKKYHYILYGFSWSRTKGNRQRKSSIIEPAFVSLEQVVVEVVVAAECKPFSNLPKV